ncbi:MAG: tetratricopeptide repeat protein [Chitinophagales bacterium]
MNRLFYIFVCLAICLITFNTDSVFAQKKKSSSSKKKKSNSSSGAKNAYQDLTTRYNRYFNAKMRYTEGIKQLETSHKDDYDELLPVYAYDKGDGTSIGGNLNEVITKTQDAIKLKPNSKWIDDCYLLMGKAYYLQGDNTSADQAFQYINGKFKNRLRISATKDKSQIAKERKEREKEKNKERLQAEKERDKERAEREKAREAEKKEKAKEKKVRDKERAADKKAKEREKKVREKERAKEKKRKAREKKKRIKAKEKAKRQRKKGKTPKKTSSSKSSSSSKKTTTKDKKTDNTSETTTEDDNKSSKAAEIEEQERLENERLEKEAEEQAAAKEEEEQEVAEIKEKTYKKGGLSHQPVNHEATVWLARSYISQEQFGDAEALLRKAQGDKSFPKRVSGQLNALEAHYYLQREDWDKAKVALQAAIKTTRKKKDKARLYYILAQLEQRDNNFAGALANFEKVLKKRPTYDMEFNAKLNIAKTKMQSGEFNADRAITYLKKMLRDSKNDEFQDQIYFTMAEIELENGDEAKATEYFADAAKNSTVNPAQKARAFLRLADLSYERENYVTASSYYDSTLVVLSKDHKRYEEISDRRIVLTDLVKHIQIVELQDSLRRIADMSDAARLAYLEDIIEQLEKEAQAEADEQQAFLEEQDKKNKDKKEGGTFYFYNDVAKAMGKNDFLGKWGQRSNTDNWRLSNKSSGLGNLADTDTTSISRNTLVALAGKGRLTVDDLMKDLPLTKTAKTQSDSLVTASLYAIGRIYHVRLKAGDKAIVSFDELLERFPVTEHSAAAHYNLYLLYKNESENKKSNQSKKVILNDYPESKYAKLLQDADYLKVLAQKERELEEYYEKTYAYFKSENFGEVDKRQKQVNDLFPENPLQPKFDLLNAMVMGHTGDKTTYMKALQDVMKKHPEDEVKDKAEEILSYLRKGGKKSNKPSGKSSAKYQYKPNSRHYFVVAFDSFSKKINTATNGLSDFNMGNFKTQKLKVNPMLLDPKNQIVLVKDFSNAEKAKIYFKTLKEQELDVFKGLDVPFKTFIISKSNFSQYFKDKKADVYYEFFLENYK